MPTKRRRNWEEENAELQRRIEHAELRRKLADATGAKPRRKAPRARQGGADEATERVEAGRAGQATELEQGADTPEHDDGQGESDDGGEPAPEPDRAPDVTHWWLRTRWGRK